MTAREFDPACEECNRKHMAVLWARGDFGNLRRKVRGAWADAALAVRVTEAKARLAETEAEFEGHVAEVHPEGFAPRPLTTVAAMAKPKEVKPIPEGKARCDVCGKAVRVVDGPRLVRHQGKRGERCTNLRMPGQTGPMVTEAPPVVIPKSRHATDTKGECRECGKWLPGERSLCGRCSVLRSA